MFGIEIGFKRKRMKTLDANPLHRPHTTAAPDTLPRVMLDRFERLSADMLFLLPALLIFCIFFVYPVLSSFLYSLTDWNGITQSANVIGLQNFINILSDRDVLRAFGVTITFAIGVTILQNGIGLLLALALDGSSRVLQVLRVVFLMPTLLSSLAIGNIFNYFYDPNFGVINQFFIQVGLPDLAKDWLGDPKIALYSIMFAHIWQWVGLSMIIFLAGLQGIPPDLQEAATMDGVSTWQRFRNITFPLIAPSVTVNLVLSLIGTIKVFDIIYVMTKGGPGGATDTLATLLYQKAFNFQSFGYGTAIAVVMFVFILGLSLVQLRILTRREVVA